MSCAWTWWHGLPVILLVQEKGILGKLEQSISCGKRTVMKKDSKEIFTNKSNQSFLITKFQSEKFSATELVII